jgi:hypothetical protein
VCSDECLNYALMNRAEWEERGDQITREMLEELTREDGLHEEGSRTELADAGIGLTTGSSSR